MSRLSPSLPKRLRSSWDASRSAHSFSFQALEVRSPGTHAPHRCKHTRQVSSRDLPDEALGDQLMSAGEHKFVLTIENAQPSGSGVCMGVASPDGRLKIGVRPSDGRLVIQPTPKEHAPGRHLTLSRDAWTERQVGARVEVTVDMHRRDVSFSLDGGIAVSSGVLPADLPDTLVPWVSLMFKNDAVTLSDHRFTSVRGQPSPKRPPKPVRVAPRRSFDDKPYEAGPWTS